MLTASGVTGETIQLVSDGFTIRAYVARPSDKPGRLPAVIVLHEWWGLNEHIVNTAKRFAAEGYAAAAIDLYSRQGYKVTQSAEEAGRLMGALSTQAALRDINVVAKHLKGLPFVDGPRLGIVGFSMGATIALFMAQHNSDFRAAVAFCGKVPPVENTDSYLCPILVHDAAKDGWVTRKEIDALREALIQHGKPGQVVRYPDADHAFYNDTRPEVYRQADAEAAWRATLQFLAAHLW